MKKIVLLVILFAAAATQISAQEAGTKANQPDTLRFAGSKSDSTEYELIVSDPGFHPWFISNSKPEWYHEKSYYELKNRFFVTNWNNQVNQTLGRPPFEYYIDYEPTIDYGLDLNYKLYWYFRYVEDKFGINLGIN